MLRAGPNGDSAWILHAAGRMLDGAVLYGDIVEMNPPLVFWISMPLVAISRALGTEPWLVLAVAVVLLVAGCGLLGWLALRRGGQGAAGLGAAFIVAAAVLPVGWFAQREHLLFVLAWPYLAVTIGRLRSVAVPTWVAVTAGGLAAVGVALKPPALVVIVALALLIVFRRRTPSAVLLPENVVGAAVLAGYAVAILAFTPGFAPTVRRLAPLYLHFEARPLTGLLFRDFQALTVWAALLAVVASGSAVRRSGAVAVFALAAPVFLLPVVIQGKGFGYHYYPAFACAVVLLIVVLASRGGTVLGRGVAAAALLLLAVLFTPVVVDRVAGRQQRRDLEREALAAVVRRSVPIDGSIVVLSPRLGDAFPLVNSVGREFGLRFPHLWWMAAMQRLRAHSPGTAAGFGALEAELRRAVAEDLRAGRPDLIIARNPDADSRYAGDAPVDPIQYLQADPEFEREFRAYQPAGRLDGYDLYRLTAP